MAELPSIPRRLVTTDTPRSSLTAADISGPYTALARGMDSIGQGLEHVSEKLAEQAGYQAVSVDAEGNPQVTKPFLFGKASDAYDRAVRFTAMTQADAQADRDLLAMRDQFKDDPDGFTKAADAYRIKKLDQYGAAAGPQLRAALDRQVQNRITGIYSGLQSEKQNRDIQISNIAITTKLETLGGDMETLARRNGIWERDQNGIIIKDENGQPKHTRQYEEGLADYGTLLDEKAGNPLYRFPKELANAKFDELRTRVEGAAVLGNMERIYQEQGPEIARRYLLDTSRQLEGKLKQTDKIVSEGLKWLRTEDAGMRGARDAISREWAAAKGQKDLAPEVLDDLYHRAQETGNFRAAQDIIVTKRAREWAASVPPEERARVLLEGRPLSGPPGGANFMTGPLPGAAAMTTVRTSGGISVTVNKQAAPQFQGFLSDLEAAGAPIRGVGGFNERKIAGTDRWSQHAYGNAIDIDQTGRNVTADAFKQWGLANKDKLATIEQKWGMTGGQNFSNPDWGHWEWSGGAAARPVDTLEMRAGLAGRAILKKEVEADLGATITGMALRVSRGEYPTIEEVMQIGGMAEAVGNPTQRRKVAEIAAMAEHGTTFAQMSGADRAAVISGWDEKLKAGGTQAESDFVASMRAADTKIDELYKKDPYGAFQRYEQTNMLAKPLPAMDMSNPGEMAIISDARLRQQNVIRARQERGPFSVFRPDEQESFRSALSSADGQGAAGLLGTIARLPDDVLVATISDKPVKDAIVGAARSQDPAKFNAAMVFMDKVWALAPETAKHTFGADTIDDLKMWQTNLRYMTPEQLAEQRKRESNDPQVRERRKRLETEGEADARKHSFDDVVSQFNTSWWVTPSVVARNVTGSDPQPPVPAGLLPPGAADVRDAFMGDFETQYAQFFARGMSKDDAKKSAIEVMKTKWIASPTNGGRLMLNGPETVRDANGNAVYPSVGGSYDWMKKQLEADIATQVGKPMFGAQPANVTQAALSAAQLPVLGTPQLSARNWTYQLISDRQTQAEAQQGMPASYLIMVTDAQTGKSTILPRRQNFDSGGERVKAEEAFQSRLEFERRRSEAHRGVVMSPLKVM